jgi:hypothetical protein
MKRASSARAFFLPAHRPGAPRRAFFHTDPLLDPLPTLEQMTPEALPHTDSPEGGAAPFSVASSLDASPRETSDGEAVRQRKYAEAAFAQEITLVAQAQRGGQGQPGRNVQLFKSAACLAEFVAAELLTRPLVEDSSDPLDRRHARSRGRVRGTKKAGIALVGRVWVADTLSCTLTRRDCTAYEAYISARGHWLIVRAASNSEHAEVKHARICLDSAPPVACSDAETVDCPSVNRDCEVKHLTAGNWRNQ